MKLTVDILAYHFPDRAQLEPEMLDEIATEIENNIDYRREYIDNIVQELVDDQCDENEALQRIENYMEGLAQDIYKFYQTR